MSGKIKPDHQSRLACVYVRQSSIHQVRSNVESTQRQRALTDVALKLGWPTERIVLIDEDLGCSGSNTVERRGYQRLFNMVQSGSVGLILAVEMSRFGRDDLQWQLLVRHCSFSNVLLADEQAVYDPSDCQDHVMLGLLGTLAQFELAQQRKRMFFCWLEKARRGELYCAVPVGYVLESGVLMKDPNERIQHVLGAIFGQFMLAGSTGKLARWCCGQGIQVPSYQGGKGCGTLLWQEANSQRLFNLLTNPCYAGAYVVGRRKIEKHLEPDGQILRRRVRKPRSDWDTIIHEHHEAYISWTTYEAHQRLLQANSPMKDRSTKGAVHRGEALLEGLLRCRRCGTKLYVRYSQKGVARYGCRNGSKQRAGHNTGCFSFAGEPLHAQVVERMFDLLEPHGVEAALQALQQLESDQKSKQQALMDVVLQRQYEADRAQRQYDHVEPENRLIASTLEKRWNESLERLNEARSALVQFEQSQPLQMRPEERDALLKVGRDVRRVWNHPDAPINLKKQIVRELIEEIVVDDEPPNDQLRCWIHWKGGLHTEITISYKTRTKNTTAPSDEEGAIRMMRDVLDDPQIAITLNRAGKRTPRGESWTADRVAHFRKRHAIAAFDQKEKKEKRLLTQQETAVSLQISPSSVLRLVKDGIIPAIQAFSGAPWVIRQDDLESERVQRVVKMVKMGGPDPLSQNENQLTLWKST